MITCTQEVRDLFMASHRQVMRITLDGSAIRDSQVVYAVLSDNTESRLGVLAMDDSTEAGADATWALLRGYIQDISGGITITEDDILVGGFVLDRYSMCTDRIEIGSAVAAELTLTLRNLDGTFDAVKFEGAEMHVELGVKDWDTDEPVNWISLGYFTADKQPKNSTVVSVTALDRMVWFDVEVDWSQLTFPCTVQSLVSQVCTICGITCATDVSVLPNHNYTISYAPDGKLSYRNLIQWCAFLTGTCAQMNEDGELVLRWYTPCGVTITAQNRYSHNIEEEDIVLTGIYYKSEIGLEYLAGTADYALETSGCLILQENTETVLQVINTARNGFTYRPFSAVLQSAPFLEPLDMITFVDKDGVSHPCIISKTTYTGNASTPVSGVGETAKQVSYANLNGLTREQEQAVDDAKKYASNYLASDDNGIMVANMTDGTRYVPASVPTGVKNTFIDADSFDVRDGQTTLASFGTTSRIGLENGAHTEQNANALRIVGVDNTDVVTMGAQSSVTTSKEETYTIPGVTVDAEGGVTVNGSGEIILPYELSGSTFTVTVTADHVVYVGTAYTYTGSSYSISYDGQYTVTVINTSTNELTVTIQYQVTQPADYGITVETHDATRIKARVVENDTVLAEGGLYANAGGNFGLFDTKRATWMIVSTADGHVKIPSLVPRLLYAQRVNPSSTQFAYAYASVPLLKDYNIAIMLCECHNTRQFLVFCRQYGDFPMLISDNSGTYIRGGYVVKWSTNEIGVAWLDGNAASIRIQRIYGIL